MKIDRVLPLVAATLFAACGQSSGLQSAATGASRASLPPGRVVELNVVPNSDVTQKPTVSIPISGGGSGVSPGYIMGGEPYEPLGLVFVEGLPADEVFGATGEVVGFFFRGPTGFVPTAVLQERANLACVADAVNGVRPDPACDPLFKSLGVVDGVAVFDAAD